MSITWVSSENTQQIRTPRLILTWSGVRSCGKILQKRLKRRHILPSARETEKESSLDQPVKNHGNGWLTSTKTQVWTEEKTLWGRVLVVTAVTIVGKRTVVKFFLLLVHVFARWPFNSLLSSAIKTKDDSGYWGYLATKKNSFTFKSQEDQRTLINSYRTCKQCSLITCAHEVFRFPW